RRSGSARNGCPSRRNGSGRPRPSPRSALPRPDVRSLLRECSGRCGTPCAGNSSPAAVIIGSMAENPIYAIDVAAATQYLAGQSDEAAGRFVFAYTITLRNTGSVAAQLISRHWIITDAQGQVQEVRGRGVVGAQPLLEPGQSFEYTSG